MRSNGQIGETAEKTFKKVSNILKLMQQHLQAHSFVEGTYFGHNRGISVLFRLIRLLERNFLANTISVSKEEFFKDLGKIFNSKLIVTLDTYYGEGGSNAAATRIMEELQTNYPKKYKEMKSNLNQLPRMKK